MEREQWGLFLILIILAVPAAALFTSGNAPSRDAGTFGLCPLRNVISMYEDELYDVNYWAVGGELTIDWFTTEADWLDDSLITAPAWNTTGNVCHWGFDMGTAADDSGHGHDGTIYGAQVSYGVGGTGNSLEFDGQDDYVEIPFDEELNITEEITLECWIYPTFEGTGEHMIISKGGPWDFGESQQYELTMDRDRILFQMKLKDSNYWYGAAPYDPITKNTWHHVAGVYDGTRFKIYIDGIEPERQFDGWDVNFQGDVYEGGLPWGTRGIYLGRREPASWGALSYEGRIDEARVWNRALTDEEVMQHASIPGSPWLRIAGTPDNGDVGIHHISIGITDGHGATDRTDFDLEVLNSPPEITTEPVTEVYQDDPYLVDYQCGDEGQGDSIWSLVTDASWLELESSTGVLSGIPGNNDVGLYTVNVSFNDGNRGGDWSSFDLIVRDVNDPPRILTEDITGLDQGDDYLVDYDAEDIDDEVLEWSLDTEARWLAMDQETGVLSGIPGNDDVGVTGVTVIVEDPRGGIDTRAFDIEVIDVNDRPQWLDVPGDIELNEGDTFSFDVNAHDVDEGDELLYEVSTVLSSDIAIDPSTGVISWTASLDPFIREPFILKVDLWVSDDDGYIHHIFNISIVRNSAPETSLRHPLDGSTIPHGSTTLGWKGSDAEDEPLLYDVYLGTVESRVIGHQEDLLVTRGIGGEEVDVEGLEGGTTYYWTVVPIDAFSEGECIEGVFSFYVNGVPTANLIQPGDGEIAAASGLELVWKGSDGDGDDLVYDLYLGTEVDAVTDKEETVRILEGVGEESVLLTGLIPGSTYYWTVIPHDGLVPGVCIHGVRQFYLNIPPVITTPENRTVTAGDVLEIKVEARDPEGGALEFRLLFAPEGMGIDPGSGVVTWATSGAPAGVYNVTVLVSDGLDHSNATFELRVENPAEDSSSNTGLLIGLTIGSVLFVAVVVAIIVIIVKRAVKGGKDADIPEETSTGPA